MQYGMMINASSELQSPHYWQLWKNRRPLSFSVRWRLSQKLAGIIGTWPELYDTVQVIAEYFEATDNKILSKMPN